MINLSLVIPCYNEGQNIEKLFNKIEGLLNRSSNIEIIIVDNGSTDNTEINVLNSKLYKESKIKVINIEENKGYGHGIMSGVKIASGEFVGWCHADLQTDPEDVYNAFIEFKKDLSSGKAIIKGLRIKRNLLDSFFTMGMSIFASLIFQRIINDINAQPKIFPKNFIKFMQDYPYDFSLDLYLLIIAKINNYKILNFEVEFKNRLYGEAKGGGSILGKLKLTIRTIIYIFKLRKKIWNI